MRKLKKVFGACLSTLLILSMTLGYVTPAVAAEHPKGYNVDVVYLEPDGSHVDSFYGKYLEKIPVPSKNLDGKSYIKDGVYHQFEGWLCYRAGAIDGFEVSDVNHVKKAYSLEEIHEKIVHNWDLAFRQYYTVHEITNLTVTFIDSAQETGKFTTDYYKEPGNHAQLGEIQTITTGQSATAPTVAPKRVTDKKGDTYEFDGWQIIQQKNKKYETAGSKVYTSSEVNSLAIGKDTIFCAHYSKVSKYNVLFYKVKDNKQDKVESFMNDKSYKEQVGEETVLKGDKLTLSPKDLAFDFEVGEYKYTFDGWRVNNKGDVLSNETVATSPITGKTEYYAHYTKSKKEQTLFTVKFVDDKGNQLGQTQTVEKGAYAKAYTYNQNTQFVDFNTFRGWKANGKTYTNADIAKLGIENDMTFEGVYDYTANFYVRKDGIEKTENGSTQYEAVDYYGSEGEVTRQLIERKQISGDTNDPTTEAAIAANVNGTLPTVEEFKELKDLGYTNKTHDIRWYVVKISGGIWKVDGVLVPKTVTVKFVEPGKEKPLWEGPVEVGGHVKAYQYTKADYVNMKSFAGWLMNDGKKKLKKADVEALEITEDSTFTATFSTTAHFYIRKDGVEQYENGDTHYNSSYYYDTKITDTVKERKQIHGKTGDPETQALIQANLNNTLPTLAEVLVKLPELKETYNTNDYYVRWYVMKAEGSWHIDGVILHKDVTVAFEDFDETSIVDPKKVTYGTKVEDTNLIPEDPTRADSDDTRYTFDGYTVKGDTTNKVYSKEELKGYSLNANTVFVAHYSETKLFTVRFFDHDGNQIGQTQKIEAGGTAKAEKAEETYSFWWVNITKYKRFVDFRTKDGKNITYSEDLKITQDIDFYAFYEDVFRTRFLAEDGETVLHEEYTVKEGHLKETYKFTGEQGKNFKGWYRVGTDIKPYSNKALLNEKIKSSHDYTPVFTNPTVTFQYDKDNIIKTEDITLNTKVGDKVYIFDKEKNAMDAETFRYWLKDDDTETKYSTEDIKDMKISKNTVFTAVFEKRVNLYLKANNKEPKENGGVGSGQYHEMATLALTVKERKSIFGEEIGTIQVEKDIADNINEVMPTIETYRDKVAALGYNPDEYRIRWYVLKFSPEDDYSVPGVKGLWHIDGVLVKTKANVTFKDDKNNVLSKANIDLGSTVGDKVFKYEASTLPNRNLDSETFRFWYKGEDKEHLYTSDEVAAMTINDDTVFTAVYEHKVTVYIRYGVEPKEYGNVMLGTYKEVGNRVLTVKERKAIYGDIEEPETEQRIADNIVETMPTADSLKDKLSALGFDSNQYTIRWYVLKFSPEDNYSDPDHVGVWHLDGILVKKPTATFYNGNEQFHQEYVTKGSRVSAPANTPVKRADASYEYSFKGWKLRGAQGEDVIDFATDDSAVVNSDVEYEAVYEKTENQYNLFFYNDDQVVYKAKVELDDTLVAPENEPTKIGDTAGEFAFQGWKVNGDADAAAYKSFGGLKVSAFESHMKDGLLVFQASYVKKNEENKVVHHLYFHTDHGTVIIGVEDGHKLAKEFIPTSADEPEDKYEEFINRFFGWKEGELPPIEERIPNVSGASLLKLFKAEKEPETFDFDTAITRDMAFDPVYKPENKIRVEFYDNNTQVGKTFFVLKDKETVTTPVAERTNTETVTYSLEGWKMNSEENVISAEDINKMTFGQDTTFYAVFNEQEVQGKEFENPDEDGEVLGEEFVNPDAEISANEETAVLGAAYGKTGDAAPVLVMIVALALSGMLGIAVTYKRRRDY